MGDSKRFSLFADKIGQHFDTNYRIADIAGGKGYLNLALTELGFDATTYDMRYKNRIVRGIKYQHRYFDQCIQQHFDLLVGMHPDGATDVIIAEAAKREIPFVLVPCCIVPKASVFWGQYKFNAWFDHLAKFAGECGFFVESFQLKMNGRNIGLIGKRTSWA